MKRNATIEKGKEASIQKAADNSSHYGRKIFI